MSLMYRTEKRADKINSQERMSEMLDMEKEEWINEIPKKN